MRPLIDWLIWVLVAVVFALKTLRRRLWPEVEREVEPTRLQLPEWRRAQLAAAISETPRRAA